MGCFWKHLCLEKKLIIWAYLDSKSPDQVEPWEKSTCTYVVQRVLYGTSLQSPNRFCWNLTTGFFACIHPSILHNKLSEKSNILIISFLISLPKHVADTHYNCLDRVSQMSTTVYICCRNKNSIYGLSPKVWFIIITLYMYISTHYLIDPNKTVWLYVYVSLRVQAEWQMVQTLIKLLIRAVWLGSAWFAQTSL